MRRTLSLFILWIILGLTARATHMSGGEIYYECIGPNQYRITMVIYRDCFGINVDPSYNLVITSPCGNRTLTVTTPGGQEISQLCDVELPNSTCNGGTLPGIQQYIYTGEITLPPCDTWTISYTNIYRNAAIANLTNPGAQRTYIRATINSASAPCNDSPQFTNTAIPYVCLGYPITYSFGAYDPEGDSLVYTLINAMGTNGAPLNYVNPYNAAQPITGLTLDQQTGEVNFTLNQMGNWVVVVQVEHYNSDGVLVGTIMRDMQFVAYPCSNDPPDPTTGLITNLSGSAVQTGPRAIEVCESGGFCFDMVINDPNGANILDAFSNIQMNLPGATFSFSGSNPITATVCWTAVEGTSGFFPFIVNVDDNACPIPAFQTYIYSVRVLPGAFGTMVTTDENCLGTADGTASVEVSAGTAPFSYQWNTGATAASITAGPGDYSVVLTDANGCVSQDIEGSIGTAGLPNLADGGGDQVACPGDLPVALNGQVVNATGGIWTGEGGTFTGNGLNVLYMPSAQEIADGGALLTLTTTGNETCPPSVDQVFISLPNSFIDATTTSTNTLCHGGTDGSATFVPGDTGDGMDLTYQWDDPLGQTTATAGGLAPGSYTVTVTDNLGCTDTFTANVGQPPALTIGQLSATNEGCLGSGDGSASVTVLGGTAPFNFAWNTGANLPIITVPSGTYTVEITDANGCGPAVGSVTVEPDGLPNEADAGQDLVGCVNAFPVQLVGTVVNATGGIWSGGAGTFSGNGLTVGYTPTAEEVAQGGVTLTLTSTGNETCPPATDQVFIAIPNSFQNAQVQHSDALCNGGAEGTATFMPQTDGFSYQWSDAQGQTTAMATGLTAGPYTVFVTDAFGCDTSLAVVIGQPDAITIASLTSEPEDCLGTGNGSATVQPAGGTAPYSFAWNTGATTQTITASTGTYTVTVGDANGCAVANGTVDVTSIGLPNEADAGPDLVGCLNELPVTITGTVVNATGGTWSGGSGFFQSNGLQAQYMPTVAEIMAGSVELVFTTTGNSTCPPASDVLVLQLSNSFLSANLTPEHVGCHGDASGSIAFSPQQSGLSYVWNDPLGQTTGTATQLPVGTYTLVVTDQLGCDTTLSATITQPAPLVLDSVALQHVTCHGGNNGAAAATISGGTPSYLAQWTINGINTVGLTAGALPAGALSLAVTDANGCTVATTVDILQPPPILLTAMVPDTVCVNAPVQLSAMASGGTGDLQVSWMGIGTGTELTHSFTTPQNVNVSVTDAAGCQGPNLTFPVYVLNMGAAQLSTYGGGTFCPGDEASVGAVLNGYPGGHTLSWTQLGTTGGGPFQVPVTGSMELQVIATDVCGNSLQGVVEIVLDQPPSIALPEVLAEGCSPHTVTFPDLGLGGGITWSWDFGDGNTSDQPIPTHTYLTGIYPVTLTVTTAAGCSSSSPAPGLVTVHAPPTAGFSASPWTTDMDAPTIQFTDASSGNVLEWEWLFGDGGTGNGPTTSHTYTTVGTFDVELTVTDENGCTDAIIQQVTLTPVHDVIIPNAFTPNPNGGNDGFWVPGDLSNDVFYPFSRFVEEMRMRIFNRWGELIFESDDPARGWDGYYRGVLSPQDVYVYQLWVKFVDGKEIDRMGDLTLFR